MFIPLHYENQFCLFYCLWATTTYHHKNLVLSASQCFLLSVHALFFLWCTGFQSSDTHTRYGCLHKEIIPQNSLCSFMEFKCSVVICMSIAAWKGINFVFILLSFCFNLTLTWTWKTIQGGLFLCIKLTSKSADLFFSLLFLDHCYCLSPLSPTSIPRPAGWQEESRKTAKFPLRERKREGEGERESEREGKW